MVRRWSTDTHQSRPDEVDMKVLTVDTTPRAPQSTDRNEEVKVNIQDRETVHGETVECTVDVSGDARWKMQVNDTSIGGVKRLLEGETLVVKIVVTRHAETKEG